MLKNSKLQVFVLIAGLLLNFTIFAPKLRPKQSWPTAKNLMGIDFTQPLTTEAQLKQLAKNCNIKNKVNCPACSQTIEGRGVRSHFLILHSVKSLLVKNSIYCGVVTVDGKRCAYSNLQKTNVITHQIAKHGLKCPTRNPRHKEEGPCFRDFHTGEIVKSKF
jgi:hypothetical protein